MKFSMTHKIVFLIITLFLNMHAYGVFSDRPLGGHLYREHVLIDLRAEGGGFLRCSAKMINPLWGITSSHCIKKNFILNESKGQVYSQDYDWKKGALSFLYSEARSIKSILYFPDYDKSDVALFMLEEAFDHIEHFTPLLPLEYFNDLIYTLAFYPREFLAMAVGHGRCILDSPCTYGDKRTYDYFYLGIGSSDSLGQRNWNWLSNNKPKEYIPDAFIKYGLHLLKTDGTRGPIFSSGDSGGAVITTLDKKLYQIGVNSFQYHDDSSYGRDQGVAELTGWHLCPLLRAIEQDNRISHKLYIKGYEDCFDEEKTPFQHPGKVEMLFPLNK